MNNLWLTTQTYVRFWRKKWTSENRPAYNNNKLIGKLPLAGKNVKEPPSRGGGGPNGGKFHGLIINLAQYRILLGNPAPGKTR